MYDEYSGFINFSEDSTGADDKDLADLDTDLDELDVDLAADDDDKEDADEGN